MLKIKTADFMTGCNMKSLTLQHVTFNILAMAVKSSVNVKTVYAVT